ncbi:UbiA family prenyltransferase [Streptomyces aidingensis]|uniref:4-hydroxybenzoate polyprenyltransferase n=1 Tax=Streptomyces aidingensis TaxID=910347 RepID=A0A1I1PID6_9ACTN|nr:UbiA family prenyltransferase [Streptomyces aidingensis]SFD09456.1 4-hydroxybenzoate polyprenyltransferase [Streptomyces aidingensis]
MAAGLAAACGRGAAGTAAVAAAVLAGQLSVGWLNDLVDAGRDARTGRADKPVAQGRLSRDAVRTAVAVAAVAAAGLSLLSGPAAAAAHLLALVSAWAYDLGVKATRWSPVPYAVSFGLLPAFVVLGLEGTPLPPWWLVAAGALLGCAAHVLNVLPDLADDAACGVRGLPHRLGAERGRAAAAVLVLAASALLVLGPPGPVAGGRLAVLPVAAVTVGAGLAAGRRPGSRAAFRAVLLVAVADVGLLLWTGAAGTAVTAAGGG